MTDAIATIATTVQSPAPARPATPMSDAAPPNPADIVNRKFEQMLWTEMLSHTGLEKAITRDGGEGAAAFARMLVEAIAEDIAATHPLGLSPVSEAPAAPPAPETARGDNAA